jgi:hypothetical protein
MSNNTNTTVALVRAMLRKDEPGICPAVKTLNGRRVSGARIEVVRQDPIGSWTWSEVQLGLATKSGRLDFSSFPRKDVTLAGYTRQVGKRQVIRTSASLTPWQEGNLSYATGRLQRGAHDEAVEFSPQILVSAEERQITRRTPKGETIQVSWMPRMISGDLRREILAGLELPAKTSDYDLVKAVNGDPDKGLIPACLVEAVVPEAVLIDLTPCMGWVAVDASTIPGLISLEEFSAREVEFAQKRDLRLNGLRKQPVAEGPKQDTAPEAPAEAALSAVTEVTEEAQG